MEATLPRHCEAFPKLTSKEFRQGTLGEGSADLCRFRTRSGQERGWFKILSPLEGGYKAVWKFHGPGLDAGTGVFPILFEFEPGQVGRPSPFTCSRCRRKTGNLYFVNGWACRTCQGLGYRTTRLQKSVRDAERRVDRQFELRSRIGAGRPKGMRHSTFENLKKELGRLDRSLSHLILPTANAELLNCMESEWMTDAVARRVHGFREDLIFGDWVVDHYR